MQNKYEISVVTICFENALELENTINSVRLSMCDGTEGKVEHIIIDGSKSMSCQKVIGDFKSDFTFSTHEPDKGIYDAMNKGLKKTTGKLIIFLNSGDVFARKFKLSEIIKIGHLTNFNKIIYGNTLEKAGDFEYLAAYDKNINFENKSGDPAVLPCHQSIFIPISFYKENEYDTKYKIAADRKLLLKAFSELESYHYDNVVSEFMMGGVSSNPRNFRDIKNHLNELIEIDDFSFTKKFSFMLKQSVKMIVIKVLGLNLYYKLMNKIKAD